MRAQPKIQVDVIDKSNEKHEKESEEKRPSIRD